MRGVVFWNTLRYTWRETMYWAIGLGATGILVIMLLPFFDAMNLVALIEKLPEVLIRAVGVGDDISILNTPEGLLAVGVFGKLLLLFVVYPVVMGLRVTSNEEEDGTMDIVLSLPLNRWQIIIEKALAYTLMIGLLVLMVFLGLWLGTVLVPEVTIDISRIAAISFNLFPIMTFVLGFTIAIGAFVRRRQTAMIVVTAFVMVSFMLQSVAGMTTGFINDAINTFSFFAYYNAAGVARTGLDASDITILLTIAIILTLSGMWYWERRDVGI